MLVFSSVEVSRFFIDYAYTFGGEFETNFGILEPRCMNKVMLLKEENPMKRISMCKSSISLAVATALLVACGGESSTVRNDQGAVFAMSGPPAAAPSATIATFSGPRNNYTITRTTTGFTVKDNVGSGGTVSLTTQTVAKFSDVSINLLIGDKSKTLPTTTLNSIIELYIAFFNRVPDADGLAYWIDQVNAGMTTDSLASNFYNAAINYSTLTGYSSSMSNTDFIKIIYKNVLGRTDVDQGGLDYWNSELSKGTSRATLIKTILNAAHGYKGDATYGWVADLLDNKVSVGSFFSIEQGLNYLTPEESITKTMNIVSKITPSSIAAAKSTINMSDSGFNLKLEVPSGGGSGKGSSRDCYSSDLYRVGVTYRMEMQSTTLPLGVVSNYAVDYKPTGNVVFKGVNTQELLATTSISTGPAAGTTSAIKSYAVINANEAYTYGTSVEVNLPGFGSYTQISTMTPPLKTVFDMEVNKPYTQTYTVKQESVGSPFPITLPDTTQTDSITFLGQESVTVPAGTFNTCKMKTDNLNNNTTTTTYLWLVASGSYQGMTAKIETADGQVKTVATKLTISGK